MWDAQIEGRKVLVAKGGNADVRRVIWDVFIQYWQSVMPLVQGLRGDDTEDVCYSIFCYVLQNVRYTEDPGDNQYVKTPARLIRDGVGDCKSMCIFICSCLKCLGIPCKMRFVSFDDREIYSHVYAVAISNGREIIVDPVERVNNEPIFNWARAYTYKKDLIC